MTRMRSRKRLLLTTGVAVAAAIAALATPALASTSATTSAGYPPPKGMYKHFTNCPLKNEYMHEAMANGFAACVWGHAPSGSITIGNITTPVTEPVTVQFGFNNPPPTGAPFSSFPAYPPLAGFPAITKTKPDLIPESLSAELGCATATNATIVSMCQTIAAKGGVYDQVYALAQNASQISDFALFSWTQPMKFKLINPLLGPNCYIGTDSTPVVLHPQLSIGPGGELFLQLDPDQTDHPGDGVIGISGAIASDTTFSAPGVLGCGPGGQDSAVVDEALDAAAGLPAASGNSLTLNGEFDIAATGNGFIGVGPTGVDAANELLGVFQDSTSGE
ncbi:MAG: hypothetical protein J2P17_30955, partial [Mycobacterium sp.]|nr:hypothetical protein [Mycobacterium sp.]